MLELQGTGGANELDMGEISAERCVRRTFPSYTSSPPAADSNLKSSIMIGMSEPQQQPSSDDDVDAEEAAEAEDIQLSLPADSQITIERFPDGLTIQIPPAGLWRGTQGLFFFALIWNGCMALFTLFVLGALFGGNGNKDK